jgi:hypothetical protein
MALAAVVVLAVVTVKVRVERHQVEMAHMAVVWVLEATEGLMLMELFVSFGPVTLGRFLQLIQEMSNA